MRDVYVVAAHTIRYGKYLDKTIPQLCKMTVNPCLNEAGLEARDLQALWFANSAWGEYHRQTCIRSQVALRPMGIDTIPMTNVENACAGGSTAFHHAWMAVASGLYDVTMALGAEKIYDKNQSLVFSGFLTGMDTGNLVNTMRTFTEYSLTEDDLKEMEEHRVHFPVVKKNSKKKRNTLRSRYRDFRDNLVVAIRIGESMGYDVLKELRKMNSGDHSPFMDVYGHEARKHMKKFGSTIDQFAAIASKNHFHSTLNPNAQYQFDVSVEEVLRDRCVTWPLTRSMCAPVGDGASSAILCDEKTVKRLGLQNQAVRIMASVIGSGRDRLEDEMNIGQRLAAKAYEISGTGPDEMHCAEVHDATAYGELHQTENLGFCPRGEGGLLAVSGATRLGGKIPVNTSGGLESRGHPIGASGLGQIHEIVTQLRGAAGKRQVEGARIGIAENGGGALGVEEAAMCVHIFEAPGKNK